MKQYDYLIVGAGLYGAVFAHEAKKAGKRCLVIDKRGHIAGNIYTEPVEGINVHRYGAHIFHTNNKAVWQYVNQFAVQPLHQQPGGQLPRRDLQHALQHEHLQQDVGRGHAG